MAKQVKLENSGDSKELQALFESIATAPQKPHLEVVGDAKVSGDSDELQNLFDSVAAQCAPKSPRRKRTKQREAKRTPAEPGSGSRPEHSCDAVYNRIGQMARQLHDGLHELGIERLLQDTAKAIPDARQRLSYIAQMTEQAASRVLNATDIAKPIQDSLQGDAQMLSARWDRLYRSELAVEEFKALAGDTQAFLAGVPDRTGATNAQLMEIMMAQDFQDLTGQVIMKVVEMAQRLESGLLRILLETMPDTKKAEAPVGLLNGPVISAEGKTDVVTNQGQVDELLESLGF